MDLGSPGGGGARGSCTTLRLAIVAGSTIAFAPLPARGSVVLGRDEGCDVRIDDRSVSRRHAVLHVGPTLRIEDLGSANGTFVGEQQLPTMTMRTHRLRRLSRESAEVVVGERFNLGATTVVVGRAPAGSAEETERGNTPEDVVVRAPAMVALYEQATRAARSSISVLILGETGVGKELLARTLHARSPRAGGPYVELHCASLPPSLLEGELFGHEKSAFTGASQMRPGLIESADGGTLFLDEIGELPLAFQVKLLRVLEDRKVLRLGGRAPRRVDLRFVAATNRDLEAEIARGNFRQDLYFRLNGISLVIPPLRERRSEIAPLAARFLAEACRQLDQRGVPRISPEALGVLEAYAWPGNVRELRNVIERAAVLCAGDAVLPGDLPPHLSSGSGAPTLGGGSGAPTLGAAAAAPTLSGAAAAPTLSGAAAAPTLSGAAAAAAAPTLSAAAAPSDLPPHLTTGAAPTLGGSGAAPTLGGSAPPPASVDAALARGGAGGSGAAPAAEAPTPQPGADAMTRLRLEMKALERQRVVEALEQSAGNQTRAAKLLGISLRTLVNRIDQYGIPRPRKRTS
ncbi:sigma 54-interacting transcriptional regulator [Sorangium sp. So ce513]|uniref:sigma 54-interacting transcriptional regulator n=1 Tax=Sorangium sp. So ce513 TaxID=3133315 RepID=UPI003F64452C